MILMRILILVVAYNAQKFIAETLSRIPGTWLQSIDHQILIIDDASEDKTSEAIQSYLEYQPHFNIKMITNPLNLGYGGTQKKGYAYAAENKYDIVVLLHGDGQYAPEYLPKMIAPIQNGNADVVLGSRMINKMDALRGQMPLYKWLGNQVLTRFQNFVLRSNLSEFHTGYRAFRIQTLTQIPLSRNSDYFDFDTEVLIQLIDTKAKIREISIPTFYGEEISYVNGFKYAWLIIVATVMSRLVKLGWTKDSRFSYTTKK